MRPTGSPTILEYRRRLAVQRIRDGYSVQAVAQFLAVDPSSVRRWITAYGRDGHAGLMARPVQGRPSKLTTTQEKIVCHWLADNPTQHGFATELWSAPRLAQLIEQEFGVHFHPDYLTVWLRRRGYTPQKPRRSHHERNDEAIAAWLAQDWLRIKKTRAGGARSCC